MCEVCGCGCLVCVGMLMNEERMMVLRWLCIGKLGVVLVFVVSFVGCGFVAVLCCVVLVGFKIVLFVGYVVVVLIDVCVDVIDF